MRVFLFRSFCSSQFEQGRRSKFYVFSCLITKNRYVNISIRPRAVNLEFYVHPRPRIFRSFGRPASIHSFHTCRAINLEFYVYPRPRISRILAVRPQSIYYPPCSVYLDRSAGKVARTGSSRDDAETG